jgi:hypothetical protein
LARLELPGDIRIVAGDVSWLVFKPLDFLSHGRKIAEPDRPTFNGILLLHLSASTRGYQAYGSKMESNERILYWYQEGRVHRHRSIDVRISGRARHRGADKNWSLDGLSPEPRQFDSIGAMRSAIRSKPWQTRQMQLVPRNNSVALFMSPNWE